MILIYRYRPYASGTTLLQINSEVKRSQGPTAGPVFLNSAPNQLKKEPTK